MESTIKKHSIKIQVGTLMIVAGFLLYWTFVFTSTFNNIKNQCDEARATATKNEQLIFDLQEKNHQTDLVMVEVRTKLSSIEALLVELKKNLGI